jgi:hypothetical protein
MSITTTVEDGRIELPAGVHLPNGTVVRIETVTPKELPTLLEDMKEFIGVGDDSVTDMAENHDHYLHGHPKK